MENRKAAFSFLSLSLVSGVLTLIMLICCLISVGIGHGSSILFKLFFPIPYSLFEFLYKELAIESSILGFFVEGFIQNFIYILIVQRLARYFSSFISYSIIIGIHLILFIIVNNLYE